jgi:hypothetical protein
MPLLNLARDLLADAIIGGSSYTRFNTGNAYMGVGESTTAFAASQTGLLGSTVFRIPMDSSFPARAANVVTWRGTCGAADGNFDWQEITIENAAAGGQALLRKTQNIGVKTNTVSRQLTLTQTFVLV